MQTTTASLLCRKPIDHSGLSFFDLPSATYPALVEGMADEHKWHFENNDTESHMAFLRGGASRLVEWSGQLRFPRGSVHLDVGAGEGILSYLVARRGYRSIAVELCATILHSATLFQTEIHGPSSQPHSSMDLLVADIYDLPLKTASVDFVTIKQVLHHLDDLDGLLHELSRVLKPNGTVYIWEPFDVSIPIVRAYRLRRVRRAELALGIHHCYHTYWTYRRLFDRWLTEVRVEREFETVKLQHRLTRNRFTMGSIYAEGRIKPYRQSAGVRGERRQIRPVDFLRDDLLAVGLQTTRCRKELLDSLLAGEHASRGQVG